MYKQYVRKISINENKKNSGHNKLILSLFKDQQKTNTCKGLKRLRDWNSRYPSLAIFAVGKTGSLAKKKIGAYHWKNALTQKVLQSGNQLEITELGGHGFLSQRLTFMINDNQ